MRRKDQNGFITKDELSDVLLHLGCKTNSSDVQSMLKEADLEPRSKGFNRVEHLGSGPFRRLFREFHLVFFENSRRNQAF